MPAGVGPRVAVEGALVVLHGHQGQRAPAVREHEEGNLLAREELLEDDALARRAEGLSRT